MKSLSLILCLTLISCLQATAQTYKIDTATISYEDKLRPCFKVQYDASPKTVKKAWDDYFKKVYDVKIKGIGFLTNKDIITAEDVTILAIGDKRMNLYASIIDAPGERSELRYFMSFGYDFFIGPDNYAAEFTAMKKILNDFSVDFLTDFYGSEASRITSEMKVLEKDIRKNDKTIKKNTKSAAKKSKEVASGMEAKNIALQMENNQNRNKIVELSKKIDGIKVKQLGVTRN